MVRNSEINRARQELKSILSGNDDRLTKRRRMAQVLNRLSDEHPNLPGLVDLRFRWTQEINSLSASGFEASPFVQPTEALSRARVNLAIKRRLP